jgi:hypothetical protein
MVAAPEPLRLFGVAAEPKAAALAQAARRSPEEGSLHRLHQAGRLVAQAQARFDVAVIAAHKAGCSWRRIGAAAGVPYQSLHRRLAEQAEPKSTGRRGRRG